MTPETPAPTLNRPRHGSTRFEVEGDTMVINMGPQHPSTHGVLRLEIETDGEVLKSVVPHMGYLHRCFEKHSENLTYPQVIPYVDRMDYLGAITNEIGYVLAVEKLMGIQVPPRVEAIRMLMVELQRIASHLVAVGTFSLDVGNFTPFMYAFRDREEILDLFEWTCGARLLYNYIWIGGVSHDLPPGFNEKLREFLVRFEKRMKEFDQMLTDNKIFIERTKSIGVVPPALAINYGLTGPNLRGSGVDWDIRRDEPYMTYADYDWKVVVAKGEFGPVGSSIDRYLVRMGEIHQSIRLVRQAMDRMPEGDVQEALPKRFKPPIADVYFRVEAARGDMGFYVMSDGTDKPWRVKVRSPCFCSLSVLPELAPGAMIADAVAVVGSLDIVLGEIDR
jgi:NADH-quinone oxidoreductase subunit D